MDARVRWMRIAWPTSTTMLELSIYLVIVGAMAMVAAHGFGRLLERLHVLEAVSVVRGPETSVIEYRAVNGTWPVSNRDAGYSSESVTKDSRLRSVEIREGGAVDITFSGRLSTLANRTVSIRAWQGTTPDLPAAWHCGHSGVTLLAPASADRTTLADEELPLPCRSHP